MILRGTVTSPMVRAVRIASHVLGMADKITFEPADTDDENDSLRQQNPLGKVPALIAGERVIYDTRVILEYLDGLAGGGRLMPKDGEARLDCHIRYALVSGIVDAIVLVVYEARYRPEEHRLESVLDRQRGKITRGLETVAGWGAEYDGGANPDMAQITLVSTLDFLDLRPVFDWRAVCPGHEGFMQAFAKSVPGYAETLPPDIPAADWR